MTKRFGIYADEGAAPFTLNCLVESTRASLDASWDVVMLKAEDILQGDALEGLDAFAIPGGGDFKYCKKLNGEGNRRIRDFIEKGGRYLGICGGAYYACAEVSFEGDVPGDVRGVRELGLFHGIACGSIREFARRFDDTIKSAAVVQIRFADGASANALYFGGPYFVPYADEREYEVLARYEAVPPEKAVAAMARKIGKGTAVLVSFHPEVTATQMQSQQLSKMIQKRPMSAGEKKKHAQIGQELARAEEGRAALWQKLLDRLLA